MRFVFLLPLSKVEGGGENFIIEEGVRSFSLVDGQILT
jgi:hypothetical protein